MEEKDSKSLWGLMLRARYELAVLHVGIGVESIFSLDFSVLEFFF